MSELRYQDKKPEDLQKLPIIGKQPKNDDEEEFLREICEFEFLNLEEPGVMHPFSYNGQSFKLFHGNKYKFPRFLARWLESRSRPIWDWRPDGTGSMKKKLIGRDPRFQMRQVFGG